MPLVAPDHSMVIRAEREIRRVALGQEGPADQTLPECYRRRSVRRGVACSFSTSRRRQPLARRCACIDVKQLSMGVGTKNAPPAWCAGGASGRSRRGFRAVTRSPPILRAFVLSAAKSRVGRPGYRYVVASSASSIRLDSPMSPRLARSTSRTDRGGPWTQRRPGRRYLAAGRSLVYEIG